MTRTFSLIFAMFLSVSAYGVEHPDDPWEPFNRKMFAFNDVLDRYLMKPVAKGYRAVMPDVLDRGISNAFNNIGDVGSLANSILQLKFKDSISTFGRITFNTTFGVFGIFDVSTEFGLPAKNEDFGQTMNHWGVPEGNYLVLPLFGPSTVSQAVGRIPDSFVDPLGYMLDSPELYYAMGLNLVDIRADILPAENLVVGDRYTFVRNAYLQQRDFLILDGKVESDPFIDDEDDLNDF